MPRMNEAYFSAHFPFHGCKRFEILVACESTLAASYVFTDLSPTRAESAEGINTPRYDSDFHVQDSQIPAMPSLSVLQHQGTRKKLMRLMTFLPLDNR